MAAERRHQVVIVGGGPVGVALAVELGQRGISCAVVERHREVGRIPKGQSLTNRTLEHFYFWHCVDELRGARLMPPGYPIGGMNAYGSLSSKYWYGAQSGQRRRRSHTYYYQANERLPQYLTEEVLRARAAQLPSVELLFERTAKSVEQDENGARVTVASEVWPYEDEVLEADYVVGCDGARSLVREQVGIERHGTDFGQKMVLAVFSSPELHRGLERLGDHTTYNVVNPTMNGARQFFGRVEVGVSWFFHAPVAPETTANDLDYLHQLMEEVAGFSFPVAFEHVGFWNLRIEVADTYRNGRVFIAGDAAHSHPPYGGFGLNSGLEDITNLGWKLAAALDGWGSDALLDSYSEERQPIFVQTGEDIIGGEIRGTAEWTASHDPERDLADFEKAWEERSTGGEEAQDYDPGYGGSPVVLGAPGAVTGIHAPHALAARAGHHLSPQTLASGTNVYEELGTGFTLLAFGIDDGLVARFTSAAAELSVPLTVVQNPYEGEVENYEAQLVLVRPDQYAAWVGTADESVDPEAVLATVSGRS